MEKNIAYRSLYLYHVKRIKPFEVSAETGITERVIRAIVKGIREPEVAVDFFEDRKTGTFERTYKTPEYKKLSKINYAMLEQRYMSLTLSEKVDLREIGSYLLEDDVCPMQSEKMLKTLTKVFKDKHGKLIDKKLQAILDVLVQPSKWCLTDTQYLC